jgi:uncharacterized membrane protein
MTAFHCCIDLIVAFFIGFFLRRHGNKEISAWLISCCVMPVVVLFDDFILPYRGGGASMWPIAFAIGSFYGTMTGGLGVVIESYYLKRKKCS